MPSSAFYKFWNTKVLSSEPKFNGIHSRNNLPKVKGEGYVINLDEFKSIEPHWIDLHVNAENVTYFEVLELNVFQKKLKKS